MFSFVERHLEKSGCLSLYTDNSECQIKTPVKAGVPICYSPKYAWEGKAGAYGIQDSFGAKFISGIVGDYYNVVGLPISRLYHELKKLNIDI